jgi:hypothetical protein
LDEGVPIVGAVLGRTGSAEPDIVLGMHVTSGAEVVASLTLGDAAKFRRVELAPRVVRLVSAPGAAELDGALGVSGNYLLLASRADALRDAGRFVAEGVAKRARSEVGLSLSANQGAVASALSRRLRELWQARRAELVERARAERQVKGRPADFADPEALLAGADGVMESWLSVLESSRALSFELVPEAARMRLELALLPGAEGAAAQLDKELVVGSLAPLLALPRAANVALLVRGEPAGHAADGNSLAEALSKLFGSRLSAEQSKQLSAALSGFAQAHHGASTAALVAPPALLLTFETTDAEAFSQSFADVLSLLELPPISSWLGGLMGKPSLAFSAKSADGVRRAHVRFQRRAAAPRSPLPPALSFVWQARDGVGRVLISADEATGFAELAAQPRLAEAPWFSSTKLGLGDQTALAVLADARLLAPSGPDDAPLLLAFGKKDERIVTTLDMSLGALRSLARGFALNRTP